MRINKIFFYSITCLACLSLNAHNPAESAHSLVPPPAAAGASAAGAAPASSRPAMPAVQWANNCHVLMNISTDGSYIELEDGSHWEVCGNDQFTLRKWRREDSMIITLNTSWFSSYDYYITNKTTNTTIRANLHIGPLSFGDYSHWITDIDYTGGHIQMENHMIWCVDPQDAQTLSTWAVNDHLIIGLYNSFFSSSDHILINVNTDDYVRVKQY